MDAQAGLSPYCPCCFVGLVMRGWGLIYLQWLIFLRITNNVDPDQRQFEAILSGPAFVYFFTGYPDKSAYLKLFVSFLNQNICCGCSKEPFIETVLLSTYNIMLN